MAAEYSTYCNTGFHGFLLILIVLLEYFPLSAYPTLHPPFSHLHLSLHIFIPFNKKAPNSSPLGDHWIIDAVSSRVALVAL